MMGNAGSTDPNWVAACGLMPTGSLAGYNKKVGELRKTDPQVDWSVVPGTIGRRSLARSLSDIQGDATDGSVSV